MLIFDRENWPNHRPWCWGVIAVSVASTAWYVVYGLSGGSWSWPAGSSPPGFVFGAVAGLIMAFEMLLWPRKSLWRGLRIGRTKLWMTGHIWLGLLTVPLLLLHGSFRFNPSGSLLAVVLMWLMLLVALSGIFGVAMQNLIPRLMLERLPAETIASQIPNVLEQYREEAERMVHATVGDSPLVAAGGVSGQPVVVERVRQVDVGRVQGRVVEAAVEVGYVPDSEPLLAFFKEMVNPYLRARPGSGGTLPLGSSRRASALFQGLAGRLRPDARPIVDRLADLCDQRRQFDLQARLHGWLHTWLGLHVAMSVALFVLMIAHIFLALKYV